MRVTQNPQVGGFTEIGSETRFGQKRNTALSSRVAVAMVPQVQPVYAGATWSDGAVVVVIGAGSEPVNDMTNVS